MRHDHIVHLVGIFQSFNLSPKGTPEGFVCLKGDSTFQINFPPELASEVEKRVLPGVKVEAEAVPFPDAEPEAHPVYELRQLFGGEEPLIVEGKGEENVEIEGIVTRLNYARRGEVNGAILDNGDFVHLRPHGAKTVGLEVGQHLEARGEVRPGWAGTRVIEASHANGISLEKPGKKHPPHHHPPHHKHPDPHERHMKPRR